MKLRLARPNRPFVISRFYCATIIFRLKAFHSFFPLVFFVFNHKSRASRVWNNNCYHDYNQMNFYRIKYTGNIYLSCMFIVCLQSRKRNVSVFPPSVTFPAGGNLTRALIFCSNQPLTKTTWRNKERI